MPTSASAELDDSSHGARPMAPELHSVAPVSTLAATQWEKKLVEGLAKALAKLEVYIPHPTVCRGGIPCVP